MKSSPPKKRATPRRPPPGDFRRQFELLLAHHPNLVYVGLSRAVSGTLQSGESGLWTTTIFASGLAAFIILNTFLMNVSERRRHISIMRAIGCTKGQMTGSLLEEGIWFGIVGTVIGMVLGVGMAFVATFILANAFDVQLPRLMEVMTPFPFIYGAIFGLSMAFAIWSYTSGGTVRVLIDGAGSLPVRAASFRRGRDWSAAPRRRCSSARGRR